MEVDGKLIFIRPHDGTGRLIFGDDSEVVIPPVEIGVDAQFEGDMASTVQLLWDANVSRGDAVELRSHWQSAAPASARAAAHWQPAQAITARTSSRWQSGAAVSGQTEARWQDSQPHNARTGLHWQDAAAARHALLAAWQEAERLRGTTGLRWQDGRAQRETLPARYQEAIRLRSVALSTWQDATPSRTLLRHRGRDGLPVHLGLALHWQDARRPPPGLSVVTPVTPPAEEPCYDPLTLGRLEFTEAWAPDGRLVFVCNRGGVAPGAPLYILPARFYMAVHSLQGWRLPDMLPIPVLEFSFQAERGSFDWSFDVSVPLSAFDALERVSGVPTRLRVDADGMRFEMVIDGRRHDEAHGGRSVVVKGRSLTALLADPNALETQRLNSAQISAQQAALQALDLSGFALDWGLTDWLIPAGAWSHSGTPLAAVQAIVEAAGGYLQSHRYLPQLIARHPYPDTIGGAAGGPWNWGSVSVVPDVEVASTALVTLGVEDSFGPDLNAVYVSGASQGVNGLYKRAGTAGDRLASPVVDPLITAIEAVRQRGRAVIGAAGAKQTISASLPVLTGASQPGILSVGQLIQVNAAQPWRGMVRSVSGTFKHGAEVRQSLQIERHLGA